VIPPLPVQPDNPPWIPGPPEELDQFKEASYLPQNPRIAAMGRRKIEIKPIKDDRNRSV